MTATASSVSGNTAANLPSQEATNKLSSEDAESAKKVHEEAQKWLRLKNFVPIGNTIQLSSGQQCEVWDRRNLGNIENTSDLDLNRKYVARLNSKAPKSVTIDTTIYGAMKDGAPRIILKAYIILS